MKAKLFLAVALLGAVGSSVGAVKPSIAPATVPMTGDYVECRTASVFAGPCHYNGELVTTGRDAILAWNVASGVHNGVNLAGVRAMAAVTSTDSLGASDPRTCEVVVDNSASPEQVAAFVDVLRTQSAEKLGTIVSVRQTSICFNDVENEYTVNAEGFGFMSVEPMPDGACCSQPNLVWFTPLQTVVHPKVGFAHTAEYQGGTMTDSWHRTEENDAFYGPFAF